MYLGGNGLNCEVEILLSGAMHFKTMRTGTGGALGMVDLNDPTKYYESREFMNAGETVAVTISQRYALKGRSSSRCCRR